MPFKPTLFQSFLAPESPDDLRIQAITLAFHAPEGEDPRFYGWWGDSDLAQHLLQSLAYRRHGSVQVIYHEPVTASDFADRKSLARSLHAQVAAALPWADTAS